MPGVNVVLAAVDEPLAAAWERYCGDAEGVQVYRGSILDVPCDAVVSPANSFGFMDGGIDALYMAYFGNTIQFLVRRAISDRHHGELLVGSADIVATGDAAIPYLIAAPTMRVPMALYESVNPYLAARAALLLATRGQFPDGERRGEPITERVKTIAFPGLGTGVGQVRPEVCARQMRVALDEVRAIVAGTHRLPPSWLEAVTQHNALFAERRKLGKRDRLW